MTDERWKVRLCGHVSVAVPGRGGETTLPGRQGRLLFAYLVINRDRACRRTGLIDALWPDDPPPAADSALSALLSKLRRALGGDVLQGRTELRLVLPDDAWVDVEHAAAEAALADVALEAHDWRDAAEHARAALEVDGQTFVADADGHWVAEQRRDLESIRLRCLECLAAAGLGLGGAELGTAEQAVRAAIAIAPFRESSHRLLMEIHEAAGNQAEALRAFDELRVLLRDELGATPGPAAMAVYERLLRGEPPPAAESEPDDIPAATWPAPLAAAVERHAFINRDAELELLRTSWRQACDGGRQLVLLAGEPGIGKTRVAAEFARVAHQEGGAMLYGRFDEETLAPYQPVVEMLRGWSQGASLEPLGQRLGPRAAELGMLLPELRAPEASQPATVTLRPDPEAQRFAFFDAVAALLGELGARQPLALIVDDLQWANRPTLQLLKHLVRAPQPRRILFVGTYRETELDGGHPLAELIADLRREGTLKRVELRGLEPPHVAELLEALGGGPAPPTFVAALHGETEGNPFFIEEVVRHLDETTGELSGELALQRAGVPEGVREVITRRLRRLSDHAREAIVVASVIGREFDYDVLEQVAALFDDALVAALEEGVEARVLREVSGRVGRYAFTHALIRATLYDRIGALRRVRLHARVGEAILRLRGANLDPYLGQLAHHFAEAAAVEQPERAADYAMAAARRADRLLAWEEAAEHYRDALKARELIGTANDRARCELLLSLGTSQERAGIEGARDTFTTATEIARTLGDADLEGRAALGFAGQWSTLARVDPDVVERLETALAGLPEADSPLRARLLARLALELYYSGDPDRRMALSEEAVAIARRLRDAATLAVSLDARHYALWRPENVEERLAVAAEVRRIAEEIGDRELELEGTGWTIVDLLEQGDMEGVDAQIAAGARLAEEVHRPLYQWWINVFRCTRAQIAGDFEEAERLAHETLQIGQRGQAENAVHYYAQALLNIRREQGRLAEVEDAVRRFVELYPAIPAWRGALALVHMELGRLDAAREEFETVAQAGFADLPRDANWLIAVTLLAEVCGSLGDAARARDLYGMLEPYAGRNVVVGRGSSCNGSASRLLGILAATMGESEVAERHFADAQAMHERMGTRPWKARTQVARAEMLLARGEDGDAAAARELLAEAIDCAAELGMVSLADRARGLAAAPA